MKNRPRYGKPEHFTLVYRLVAAWCLLATTVFARIPTGLSQSDLNRLTEYLGAPATTRLMRSAEAYDVFPGFRFAVEVNMLPTADLNSLGDKNGTFAGINPTPRFSFSKGIAYGFEIQLNYFPENVMNVLSGMGGALKWNIIDEREEAYSGALFASYTSLSGFEKSYLGSDIEGGILVSKDYVRVKPFAGAGLILSKGQVPSNYAARPDEREGRFHTVHSFVGCEIQLPVNLTFQLDLMNLSPMVTLLVGMAW